MSNNIDNNPIATSDTEDCSIFSSSSMNKKSSGRPREEVWDDYNIDKKNGKYYYIQCKYCSTHWQRGIPANMELHLANECSSCPQYKQKYWQDKIENRRNNYQRTYKTKRRKSTYLVNTNDSESLKMI